MTRWKLVPVEPDDEMVGAACEAGDLFRVDFVRAFEAAIEEAPPPPKLSDERILHHLDAIIKASGSGMKNYSMHKTIEDMKQAVRAIEREILGGGHE